MSIVKQIIELYIRKRVTKDIDHNPPAALLLLFVSVAITTIAIGSNAIFKPPLATAIAAVLIELSLSYAILNFYNKTPRFVQMITASMGVAVIGNLLILITFQVRELLFFQVIIQFWGIYLSASILRDVLESSFFKSLALIFAATFISLTILISMFGDIEMIEKLQEQNSSQPSAPASSEK